GSLLSARAAYLNVAGSRSAPRAPRGSSPNATGARLRWTTAACSSGSPRGDRSGARPLSGRSGLGGGEARDELSDVIVRPPSDLERKRVTDAMRDPHLRERQLLATPRVARGDHAILVAPEDERRDLAQLRQWTVDPDPKLLAARQECSRLAPAPRLIGPDDRARRECARTRARAMTHEPCDEPLIVPSTAADEDAPGRRRGRSSPTRGELGSVARARASRRRFPEEPRHGELRRCPGGRAPRWGRVPRSSRGGGIARTGPLAPACLKNCNCRAPERSPIRGAEHR